MKPEKPSVVLFRVLWLIGNLVTMALIILLDEVFFKGSSWGALVVLFSMLVGGCILGIKESEKEKVYYKQLGTWCVTQYKAADGPLVDTLSEIEIDRAKAGVVNQNLAHTYVGLLAVRDGPNHFGQQAEVAQKVETLLSFFGKPNELLDFYTETLVAPVLKREARTF